MKRLVVVAFARGWAPHQCGTMPAYGITDETSDWSLKMDETPRDPRDPRAAPGDNAPQSTGPERIPNDPPLAPGERMERTETVERGPTAAPVEARGGTPMWAWLLPLVLVVMVLAWFIFSRGEPSDPFGSETNVEINAPTVDLPDVDISTPDVGSPPPAAAPATEPAPAADEPAGAAAPPD